MRIGIRGSSCLRISKPRGAVARKIDQEAYDRSQGLPVVQNLLIRSFLSRMHDRLHRTGARILPCRGRRELALQAAAY